jgi:hypothetical protein
MPIKWRRQQGSGAGYQRLWEGTATKRGGPKYQNAHHSQVATLADHQGGPRSHLRRSTSSDRGLHRQRSTRLLVQPVRKELVAE